MRLGDGDSSLGSSSLASDIIDLSTKIEDLENLSVLKQIPYLTSIFDGKTLNHMDEVKEEIINILNLKDENIILGVTGLSGAGKGTLLHVLQHILLEKPLRSEKIRDKNGRKIKDKNGKSIRIEDENGGNSLSSGYTFPRFNKSIFLSELDCFFKLIDRYTRMLENEDRFRELYSDDLKLIGVLNDFFTKSDKFVIDGIYQKTVKERELKQGLSKLTIQEKREGVGNLIVLDGVNSSHIMDLYNEIHFNRKTVEKILMLSPTEENIYGAFCRVLNRDVIGKGRDLDTITEFRLIETFYIMKIYVLDTLKKGLSKKDSFTIIDLPYLTDNHLSKAFMSEVIISLEKSRNKLLETNLFPELRQFVEEYGEFLTNNLEAEIS